MRRILPAAALLLSLVVITSCGSSSAGVAPAQASSTGSSVPVPASAALSAAAPSGTAPAGVATSGTAPVEAAPSGAVLSGAGTSGGGTSGGDATCSYPSDGTTPAKQVTAPPAAEANTGTADVTIALTGGAIEIAMDRSKTPCTIGSFTHLATAGYFDGTTCHRLTTSASLKVLQCGDPTGTGGGTPGYSFADETNAAMTYPAGTVAMANAGPDTNGSQFFLVYADSQLPPSYTVFGHITAGLDVLTKIAAAGTDDGSQDHAPKSPVTITKVAVSS